MLATGARVRLGSMRRQSSVLVAIYELLIARVDRWKDVG